MAILKKRELRILLFTVIFLGTLAGVITAVTYKPKRPPADLIAPSLKYHEHDYLFPSDFVVPESYETLLPEGPILSRVPHTEWTREEIDEFWIDPGEIGIEYLERKNDELVRDILGAAP